MTPASPLSLRRCAAAAAAAAAARLRRPGRIARRSRSASSSSSSAAASATFGFFPSPRPRRRTFDASVSSAPSIVRRSLSDGPGIRIPVRPGESAGSESDLDDDGRPRKRRKDKKSSRHRKEGGQSSYKFVDRARIRAAGGDGGNGCVSYSIVSRLKKRPDGGNGGRGGSVILVAHPGEQTLSMDRHHHAAESGGNGGPRGMDGRGGRNRVVRVPCGVVVRRVLGFDEYWDEEEGAVRVRDVEEGVATAPEREDVELPLGRRAGGGADDLGGGADEGRGSDERSFDEDPDEDYDKDYDDDEGDDEYEEDYEDDEHGLDREVSFKRHKKAITSADIEPFVNTGERAPDGYFHWRPEGTPHDDDDLTSSNAGIYEERERIVLADLDKPGSYVVVAYGGRGGIGNTAFASRQYVDDVEIKARARSRGRPGETAYLDLELKLIADVGLVGFPNAGKSSLLAAMSMARPEIASYPFTTLHPLVGTIEYRDGFRVVAADVPGLIDGASAGRGRGHDFLRHLERTRALLYIVDAAGVDGRDPVTDLRVLADEIGSYGDGDMLGRPALVVANKLDLIPAEEEREAVLFEVALAAEEVGIDVRDEVHGISAGVTGEGLGPLSRAIRDVVTREAESGALNGAKDYDSG